MQPKFETIIKQPTQPPQKPEERAAVLFIHGFGDDGPSVEPIVTQIQGAHALPHVLWALPTAPVNRDAMDTAWYAPTGLPAVPPPRPELADDEDEPGMLAALAHLEALLAELETAHGVPRARTVVAGFSQGCAMALLLALLSSPSSSSSSAPGGGGRLAGCVGLMGYLPLGAERLRELRSERGVEDEVGETTPPLLLVRGVQDRLVPRRYWTGKIEGLRELGVREEGIRVVERQGLGHVLDANVLGEMCAFIEEVVPGPKGEEAK